MTILSNRVSHPFVEDGTVSDQAAYCGLGPDDIIALREKHPYANILVKFRSMSADWSEAMSVKAFPCGSGAERNTLANVRNVFLRP